MKYLKKYNIFNESDDWSVLRDIDNYLIDFIQLGFKSDVSLGSSYILDFDEDGIISTKETSIKQKGISNNSLTITLESKTTHDYNIDILEDSYLMISSFLKTELDLIPNYIMIRLNQFYFKDFDVIRDISDGVNIRTKKIILGFYKN